MEWVAGPQPCWETDLERRGVSRHGWPNRDHQRHIALDSQTSEQQHNKQHKVHDPEGRLIASELALALMFRDARQGPRDQAPKCR
jgi:hypothetical protein